MSSYGTVIWDGQPLRVEVIDKRGPMFRRSDVDQLVAKKIRVGNYFSQKGKRMSDDLSKAKDQVDRAISEFGVSVDILMQTEAGFAERVKAMNTRVRENSQRMAEGIARVEKAADLPRLERYCEIMERMATSMERLAALESTGALTRIAGALKS